MEGINRRRKNMSELIKVSEVNNRPTVLGRDLHTFLEVETPYTMWFKRMCEYGFEDGKDFITFLLETNIGRPETNHQLTLDMAKELSMIQRTDKGKQARQYFIECEKQLLNEAKQNKSLSQLEVIHAMLGKQIEDSKRLDAIEEKQKVLEAKLITRQEDFYSVAGYCSLNGIKKTSTDCIGYGKKCVALSKKLGITIGTVPDSKYGKVNIYHIDVLRTVFDSKL